jgi:hypothetical protein
LLLRLGTRAEGPLELAAADEPRPFRLIQLLYDRPHRRIEQAVIAIPQRDAARSRTGRPADSKTSCTNEEPERRMPIEGTSAQSTVASATTRSAA